MICPLHPDIIQFWEGQGYEVKPRFNPRAPYTPNYKFMLWDVIAAGETYIHATIAHTYTNGKGPTVYFLANKSYTEEEMLKVIKLKAFL